MADTKTRPKQYSILQSVPASEHSKENESSHTKQAHRSKSMSIDHVRWQNQFDRKPLGLSIRGRRSLKSRGKLVSDRVAGFERIRHGQKRHSSYKKTPIAFGTISDKRVWFDQSTKEHTEKQKVFQDLDKNASSRTPLDQYKRHHWGRSRARDGFSDFLSGTVPSPVSSVVSDPMYFNDIETRARFFDCHETLQNRSMIDTSGMDYSNYSGSPNHQSSIVEWTKPSFSGLRLKYGYESDDSDVHDQHHISKGMRLARRYSMGDEQPRVRSLGVPQLIATQNYFERQECEKSATDKSRGQVHSFTQFDSKSNGAGYCSAGAGSIFRGVETDQHRPMYGMLPSPYNGSEDSFVSAREYPDPADAGPIASLPGEQTNMVPNPSARLSKEVLIIKEQDDDDEKPQKYVAAASDSLMADLPEGAADFEPSLNAVPGFLSSAERRDVTEDPNAQSDILEIRTREASNSFPAPAAGARGADDIRSGLDPQAATKGRSLSFEDSHSRTKISTEIHVQDSEVFGCNSRSARKTLTPSEHEVSHRIGADSGGIMGQHVKKTTDASLERTEVNSCRNITHVRQAVGIRTIYKGGTMQQEKSKATPKAAARVRRKIFKHFDSDAVAGAPRNFSNDKFIPFEGPSFDEPKEDPDPIITPMLVIYLLQLLPK